MRAAFLFYSAALQKTASMQGFCKNNQEGAWGGGEQTKKKKTDFEATLITADRDRTIATRTNGPRDASFEIQPRHLGLRLGAVFVAGPFLNKWRRVCTPFEVSKENPELLKTKTNKKHSNERRVATEWKASSVMARRQER